MIKLVAGVLLLGVAGFDPFGFLALLAAMALGAGRRAAVVLLATVLTSTAVFGVAASFGLAAAAQRLIGLSPQPSGRTWAIILVAAGVALTGWGVLRWRSPAKVGRWRAPGKQAAAIDVPVRGTSTLAMLSVGLLIGLSALIDPAFYAMALLAGGTDRLAARLGVVIGWTLLSQIALVVAAAFVLIGSRDTLRARLDWLRDHFARTARPASAILLLLLGAGGVVAGVLEFAKLA